MKRLLSFLTISCAAGLPLTAAAFDFGPEQHFLAAETRAPSLSGSRADSNPFEDAASRSARSADEEPVASTNAESGKRTATHPASARRNAASAAAAGAGAGSPQRPPSALSWQSLLPGSIQ